MMHTENTESHQHLTDSSSFAMSAIPAKILDSPGKPAKAAKEAHIKSTINICRMTQQMIDVNLKQLEKLRTDCDVSDEFIQQNIRTLEVTFRLYM